VYKIWKRHEDDPIFNYIIRLLESDVKKLDSRMLKVHIKQIYGFCSFILKDVDFSDDKRSKKQALKDLTKLYIADGIYRISNNILPEGYGAKAIYDMIKPYLSKNKINFSQFLSYNSTGFNDKKINEIKKVYRILVKCKEDSYRLYRKINAVGKRYYTTWYLLSDLIQKRYNLSKNEEIMEKQMINLLVNSQDLKMFEKKFNRGITGVDV
jgi:hypothetical protein